MTDKNQLRIDDKTLPEIRKIVYDLEADCMNVLQKNISEVEKQTGLRVEAILASVKHGLVTDVDFVIDFKNPVQ